MTWLYLLSGALTVFMGWAMSLWCGSSVEKNNRSDARMAFWLSMLFYLIAAAFLFSAGIAWVAP